MIQMTLLIIIKNKQIHLLSKNSPQCKLYQGSNFYIGSIDKKNYAMKPEMEMLFYYVSSSIVM